MSLFTKKTFLKSTFYKNIIFFRKKLWNFPEIKTELIGNCQATKSMYYKNAFKSLIHKLASAAIKIFIENPRSRVPRIRIMEQYHMELISLNKFIIDGRIVERGIIQFLAGGIIPATADPFVFDRHTSNEPFLTARSQFGMLRFPSNSELLEDVQTEIEQDIAEFLNCMENSVYYWSGIREFYGTELDKIRQHFIDLQTHKNRWNFYFEKYVMVNTIGVLSPLPHITKNLQVRQIQLSLM